MKWDADLYDQKHDFVSGYGKDVIALLSPRKGERILDIGCGTGDLAEIIHKKGATVIGLDNSNEMIEAARRKYPHIRFDNKNANDFVYDVKFDAVFSNATLHWVLEYDKVLGCIYNVLKPNGRFVAEFGGKGNVASIVTAIKNALAKSGYPDKGNDPVWYFPSLSEYTSLLEKSGFRVVFASHFDRETVLKDDNGIINWLQMFGQHYLKGLPDEAIETVLKDVEEQIRPTNFKNGNWSIDYVRLRVVALKQ